MVMLLVSVIAVATASMAIGLPIVVLTNKGSDGSSSQKYSFFFCATFRKIGDNNLHVRNFKFADKIWPNRFRRSVPCEIYTTSIIVRSRRGNRVSALQHRPSKARKETL